MSKASITRLIEEIEALNNIDFEKFCYIIIEALTGQQLHHRGLTSNGQPSGYTVDSYSNDGSIVGEYSVDKDYFKLLSKPENDVNHVIKQFPDVKYIYLLAGVSATPTQGINMANLCNTIEANSKYKIRWFDSKKIAEFILPNLLTQNIIIEKLGNYLKSLTLIYNTNINTVNLPQLPNNYRISNNTIESSFEILYKNRLVYITGISGLGKTMLSVKLAEILKKETLLNAIYFIDGYKIKDSRGLYAVDLEMAGSKINLLGTLKKEQALFIIDDLCNDIDSSLEILWNELINNVKSYVIVTSQIRCIFTKKSNIEYKMPFLEEEKNVEEIINWRLTKEKKCPTEILKVIHKKTNGHPMLLNALRTLVEYEDASWQEIDEELKEIASFEVEEGVLLTNKILSRHKNSLSKELFVIKWLNAKYISEHLLQNLISKEGIKKLRVRSFIQKANGVIKVHDIIFECITEMDFEELLVEKYKKILYKRFYDYFIFGRNEKSPQYFKALHLHENKIIEFAIGKSFPGVEWYFYLQAFPNDDMKILNSISFSKEELCDWLKNEDIEFIIGTILEHVEEKSRRIKKLDSNSQEEYKKYIDEQIIMLNSFLNEVDSNNSFYLDILHHLGKLYRNLNNMDKALECFSKVMELSPNNYETKLQIIRLKKNSTSSDEASILSGYVELLDAYLNHLPISMSVVLAVYSDLYSYDKKGYEKNKYFLDHFDDFKNAISSMAVEVYDQPYNVLALVSKFYTYNYPDKLMQLVESIPIPSTEMINKKNFFDIAQMYKEIGKCIMWSDEFSATRCASNYFSMAEVFYELIDNSQLKSAYHCVQRAENLLLLEKYNEALEVLNANQFQDDVFWQYRVGQGLSKGTTDDKMNSLRFFRRAIEMANSQQKLLRHQASFYHAVANVLADINDKSAQDYYTRAIEKCDNSKYKMQIENDLNKFQSRNA